MSHACGGVDRDHRASLGRRGAGGARGWPRGGGGVLDVVGGGVGVAARRRGAPGGGWMRHVRVYGLARPFELKNATWWSPPCTGQGVA